MNVKIEAKARVKGKKSDLTNLRNDGFIPAVIYGEGQEGILISLDKVPFLKTYKKTIGEFTMFNIDVEGKSYTTILKDKQVHPVSREFVHIDFQELHKGVTITVSIPIKYVGDPIGVTEGGMLDIMVRELEITCLPKDIPEDIEVDLSNLKLDESLHLEEVGLEGFDFKIPGETTLASVRTPKTHDEETDGEAEEGEVTEETPAEENEA